MGFQLGDLLFSGDPDDTLEEWADTVGEAERLSSRFKLALCDQEDGFWGLATENDLPVIENAPYPIVWAFLKGMEFVADQWAPFAESGDNDDND